MLNSAEVQLRNDNMPIIDNSDEQNLQKHPLYDSLFLSASDELIHADLGPIFICKKEWLIQIIDNLESHHNATLGRRLAHSSLNHSLNLDYNKWMPKNSIFQFFMKKRILESFESWANNRVNLGRGHVTVISWPYSFHIQNPLMVSIEVGEICAFVQSVIGKSLRYQWRDDGGNNASITFEPIDVPISDETNILKTELNASTVAIDIDDGTGWPNSDGVPLCVIPTNVMKEFYRTMHELPEKEITDPLIQESESTSSIDEILCLSACKASSTETQRYILDTVEQIESWFCNRIESFGFGKLRTVNFENNSFNVSFDSFIPWPIIGGIFLNSWQRNSGLLGKITNIDVSDSHTNIAIISRREIAEFDE